MWLIFNALSGTSIVRGSGVLNGYALHIYSFNKVPDCYHKKANDTSQAII